MEVHKYFVFGGDMGDGNSIWYTDQLHTAYITVLPSCIWSNLKNFGEEKP